MIREIQESLVSTDTAPDMKGYIAAHLKFPFGVVTREVLASAVRGVQAMDPVVPMIAHLISSNPEALDKAREAVRAYGLNNGTEIEEFLLGTEEARADFAEGVRL